MKNLAAILALPLLAAILATPARADDSKVLKMKDTTVVGKIQKPEIAILITKQNLDPPYDLQLKESFVPRILESVEQKPF